MALSPKIGIRPNMVLKIREFSHLVKAFTVWEMSRSLGLCSLFLGVPCSSWKKRRSLDQVFEDQGMENSHLMLGN